MKIPLEEEHRSRIKNEITRKYKEVAKSPEGLFRYPVGEEGLRSLGYDRWILEVIPKSVRHSFCGVGNPFVLAPVRRGEHVLDVGCGAGFDTLAASLMAGSDGMAVGVDMVFPMLIKALENRKKTGVSNVAFQAASAEALPFADGVFDAVISNGVFNLVPDKGAAFSEAFRVLRPGGRLVIADQILIVEPPGTIEEMVESWFQ